MQFEIADRLKQLPPYLFEEIDRAKSEAVEAGKDIIDLGVGDPDLPTPDYVIKSLARAAEKGENHRYALNRGLPEMREAIASQSKIS